MKEFNKAYLEILNSRVFYESVLHKDIVLKAEKQDFYKNLVEFYKDGNDYSVIFDEFDLVVESHEDAKLEEKIHSLIYESYNFSQIGFSQIFSCISNKLKSKYSLKLNEDFPVYVFKFDFQNPDIIYRIFKSFQIQCESDKMDLPLKEKTRYENEIFKKNVGNCSGLYFNAGNCRMLFFNTNEKNSFNKSIIEHEIFHLIQDVFNVHISLKKDSFNEIPELRLSENDLKYLYQPDEFEAHIKVDLIDQLFEVYWKFFKKEETGRSFIGKFISQTKSDPLNIYGNEVINKIPFNKIKHADLTAIRLFYSTFLLKDKFWSQLAVQWLNDVFSF